jgi:hypothetical protein
MKKSRPASIERPTGECPAFWLIAYFTLNIWWTAFRNYSNVCTVEEIEFVRKPPPWSDGRIWGAVLLGLLLFWFAVLVWPTGDRYEHSAGMLVRIDRWSGEADVLTDSGWVKLSAPARTPATD